ncbi:DUF3265 domain-containing protein [Vibrio kanaloae]|nr:DUF3265 domain-containing protein [Vibrio kanaloae]
MQVDSQRVAVLVCSECCVYGVMQRLGQCIAHHLIGRYALYRSKRISNE